MHPGVTGGVGTLKQHSVPQAKVTLIANRQASNLNIGDVFQVHLAVTGYCAMVMRVLRVSWHADRRWVRIECVEEHLRPASASYVSRPRLQGISAVMQPLCRIAVEQAPWWTGTNG